MNETPEDDTPKPPLYLKQVQIRNYAPLLDVVANIQQGLNIIIGPNGTGKTRFLNLASQLIIPFIVVDESADCELIIGYDKDINIHFQQFSLDDKTHFHHPLHSVASEVETELGIKLSYKNQEVIGDSLDEALWNAGIKETRLPEPILAKHGTPLQQLLLVDLAATLTFKIPTGKIESTPKSEGFIYSSRPVLVSSIFGTLGHSFARNRLQQRRSKLPFTLTIDEVRNEIERTITSYLDFLNPYISSFSPISKLRLSNTYQVYNNASQQEIVVKGLVLEYLLGESWLPFSALSDGTKRILYLITQMVMPIAAFDEQQQLPTSFILISAPRIIFLEEPELGIHPAQLTKVLNLIREVSKTSQIIMTTHAPQVLDMLGADELDRITICSLDPEKGTQFRKLSEEQQEQARTYMRETGFLSDYWRYSYLEGVVAE